MLLLHRLTRDDQVRLEGSPAGHHPGALHREIEYRNFVEAFGSMAMVDHRGREARPPPDWSNAWNKVVIDIASHSEGGVTETCLPWPPRINRALGE